MPTTVGSTLTITVVRTSGFAGLKREWSVTAPPADRSEWLPLVEACPWKNVPTDTASRDRFVWVINVTATRIRRRASVPDSSLTGPWRELVDRVQRAK